MLPPSSLLHPHFQALTEKLRLLRVTRTHNSTDLSMPSGPYGQSLSILLKCYSIRISNKTYNFDNRCGYECSMLQCGDGDVRVLLVLTLSRLQCRRACYCVKPIDLRLSLIFTQSNVVIVSLVR